MLTASFQRACVQSLLVAFVHLLDCFKWTHTVLSAYQLS